jgi:hypothetical protein
MPNYIETMDWNDTFLDMEHLKACFPEHVIKVYCTNCLLECVTCIFVSSSTPWRIRKGNGLHFD